MPEVRLKFFPEPVERTEEEIAELRAEGLVVEDQPKPQAPPPGGKDKKESNG
jgi:hypothetical protein